MAIDACVVAVKGRDKDMEGRAPEKMREPPFVGRNKPISHLLINENALLTQKPEQMRVLVHLAVAQEVELIFRQKKPVAMMGGDKSIVPYLL